MHKLCVRGVQDPNNLLPLILQKAISNTIYLGYVSAVSLLNVSQDMRPFQSPCLAPRTLYYVVQKNNLSYIFADPGDMGRCSAQEDNSDVRS